MDALILATCIAVALVGGRLFWRNEKKQQRLWMNVRRAEAKAVDARVARIEEELKLKGRSTPLHFTSEPQVIRLLLGRNEDPNAQDEHGRTPLHWAAGVDEGVRLLLEAGAKPNARAKDGETPLHRAASGHGEQDIPLLVAAGANPNAQDVKGRTPLHRASEFRHWDAAHWLAEGGADINARDQDGATPLHLAAESGSAEVAHVLLDRGADVNAKSHDGATPLHRLAAVRSRYFAKGQAEVAQLLLEGGADVNAKDEGGATPLYWAVRIGYDEALVRALLGAGADPDVPTGAGNTPREAAVPAAAALLPWPTKRGRQ